MQGCTTHEDIQYLGEAVKIAHQAELNGNLPIGALILLDGEVIARGENTIWKPNLSLTRHAEMEALRAVPVNLWPRAKEMTLYTTLEPCVMCAGAVLLHRLGRLVFGAMDPHGGADTCLGDLPYYFREQLSHMQWCGPGLPEECDPLFHRAMELINQFPLLPEG